MNIFIVPVSGGGFCITTVIMQMLGSNNVEPDMFLASSGGNLASYIASASNMDHNMIEMNFF